MERVRGGTGQLAAGGPWSRLVGALAAAVFPPRCGVCDRWLPPAPPAAGAAPDTLLAPVLCRSCGGTLQLATGACCQVCGRPFDAHPGRDHRCGECLETARPYGQARSAGLYAGALRVLIQRLKYDGRTHLAGPLGELLRETFLRHWARRPLDAIVPVPVHRRRLRRRGFNQVQRLLAGWPKNGPRPDLVAVDVPIRPEWLRRGRPAPPQAGLDREARRRNLRDAFVAGRPRDIRGRRLLLVDDVMTTGATAVACTEALLAAGARRVDVLTVARVVEKAKGKKSAMNEIDPK